MIKHLRRRLPRLHRRQGRSAIRRCTVADNAKTQRLGTCNTMETLLVARAIATGGAAAAVRDLRARRASSCAATSAARALVPGMKCGDRGRLVHRVSGAPSSPIRMVDGLDEAIEHIATYGSQHTDAIVTEDLQARPALPARSRFELGHGQRLDALRRRLRVRAGRRDRHLDQQAACARPVGLEGLTSLKWVVIGDGHVRQ